MVKVKKFNQARVNGGSNYDLNKRWVIRVGPFFCTSKRVSHRLVHLAASVQVARGQGNLVRGTLGHMTEPISWRAAEE